MIATFSSIQLQKTSTKHEIQKSKNLESSIPLKIRKSPFNLFKKKTIQKLITRKTPVTW